MYEKAFLITCYEVEKKGVELPWAAIAHRLDPGTTGDAVKQAVARLHQTLLAEGHMVPPETALKDNWTRGLTRLYPDSFHDDDILYCRPVGWLEDLEHLTEKKPSANRLTFNGTHKFSIQYSRNAAEIPDEWKSDRSQRQGEVRLSSKEVIAQANALADAEKEDFSEVGEDADAFEEVVDASQEDASASEEDEDFEEFDELGDDLNVPADSETVS